MIDTHCHIYLEQFSTDIDQVLDRAHAAGVRAILMPAIDFDSIPEMERLDHYGITFFKMAGVHPCEIKGSRPRIERLLMEHASRDDMLAVGETGLDYYWSKEYIGEQQESLRKHCRVAKTVKKPVVLHNRDATADLLKIIGEEQDGSLSGVWHCFNGSIDEGLRAIDLGLALGIGGVITFKNAGVDKTVSKLPVHSLLLETDAPYLAPVPYRGTRNEPSYVKLIAQKFSDVLGLTFEEVVTKTSDNAQRLFGIKLN
ncbi:MAG: TatD family hydrolase [Cyclonatronaceae bacterium]